MVSQSNAKEVVDQCASENFGSSWLLNTGRSHHIVSDAFQLSQSMPYTSS